MSNFLYYSVPIKFPLQGAQLILNAQHSYELVCEKRNRNKLKGS